MAASSSSAQDPSPSITVRPVPQTSRRLPPPCWTHEETVALIDAYREKWYSLRRGNLRAPHWEEVADAVSRQCPLVTPSKTSVQCRHKIEKLRKRYRTEKQRALAAPNRYSSSWVLFRKMDSMEKGPSPVADSDLSNNSDDGDGDNEEEDEDEDDGKNINMNSKLTNTRSIHRLMNNRSGSGGGFRFKIPAGSSPVPTFTGFRAKNSGGVDENPNFNPNPNPNTKPSFSPNFDARFFNGCSSSRSEFVRRNCNDGGGSKREMDPMAEMVSSIRSLGEGFVKMEQMKIEMAREIESMRMEMELKRTEMILESQQRIVDAFAKGFSAKKKVKRMPSPDS